MKLFRRKALAIDHNADFYGSYEDTVSSVILGKQVLTQRFEGPGTTHATVVLTFEEACRMLRDLRELLEGADDAEAKPDH